MKESCLYNQVIVMGAGPGGLAAAHRLSSNGILPLVLEKQEYVAGLCHTLVREGFRFDIGGHRWYTKNEELNDWFLELMQDELVQVNRVSRIYFDGRYYQYPIRVRNVLRNAGWLTSAHAVFSYLATRASSSKQTEAANMEDAYIQQFGRKLYEMFFKQYSEKVWGRDCTEISSDWVQQRTRGLSVLTTVRDALLGSRNDVESLVEQFWYPRLGYSRICERMAEDIVAAGGEVRLRHNIQSVVHDGKNIRAVNYSDSNGETHSIETDALVSSIPLNYLVRNLKPEPPADVMNAAARLRFRDLITVNVMLNRELVTDDTWLYIHDRSIPFARLHEPKNWSRDMAPPGKTSLVAELFCSIGDDIWKQSDEELCELTVHHLSESLKFIRKEEVLGAFAFRAPKAYPVYSLDYHENLQIVKDYLSGLRNLQIIGRGGTFRYNNSDHSIEMGLLAAGNLLGEKHRIDSVNEKSEYLEEKRLIPSPAN